MLCMNVDVSLFVHLINTLQGLAGHPGPQGPEGKPGTQVPILCHILITGK